MKNGSVEVLFVVLVISVTTAAYPGLRSGVTSMVNDTIDGGGQHATSANYTIDGSIGGISGTMDGGAVALKPGYIGQLTEVTNLIVTMAGDPVNEGDTNQLGGVADLDDGSTTVLSGAEIAWLIPVYPVGSISTGGQAVTLPVYGDTSAGVTGTFMGVTARGVFVVRDSNPDNCGLYANDHVPDGWQVRYFGVNNPLGVGCATNCSGQINLYTYTADLDPTNPASVFEVVAISNQSPNRVVCFGRTSTGRVYRLLYATNLVSGAWTNLPGQTPVSGLAGQMSLFDTNAASVRFYRVEVQVP